MFPSTSGHALEKADTKLNGENCETFIEEDVWDREEAGTGRTSLRPRCRPGSCERRRRWGNDWIGRAFDQTVA